jgi:hypothetical protein
MTSKQGVFGKVAGKQGKQNQMCVVFGKTADVCITGGGDGAIYIWMQTILTRRVDNAHAGPLFTITAVQEKVSVAEETVEHRSSHLSVGIRHWRKGRQSYSLGS